MQISDFLELLYHFTNQKGSESMFYSNFDKLCRKIGTTPTAFTKDILNLSTSKVTAWKNGSIPKYEILQQIADVFNVSVGELFDGEKETATTEEKQSEYPEKAVITKAIIADCSIVGR